MSVDPDVLSPKLLSGCWLNLVLRVCT